MGSTPFLMNLVGVHPRNIHTKFKANQCSKEKIEKVKSCECSMAFLCGSTLATNRHGRDLTSDVMFKSDVKSQQTTNTSY